MSRSPAFGVTVLPTDAFPSSGGFSQRLEIWVPTSWQDVTHLKFLVLDEADDLQKKDDRKEQPFFVHPQGRVRWPEREQIGVFPFLHDLFGLGFGVGCGVPRNLSLHPALSTLCELCPYPSLCRMRFSINRSFNSIHQII